MSQDKHLDSLIHEGISQLATNMDAKRFQSWRERSRRCLVALLGPDHYYAQSFSDLAQGEVRRSILTGTGILSAVQLQEDQSDQEGR